MNLIERLRNEAGKNGGAGSYAWCARELCGKSADVIERLKGYAEHPMTCEWWRLEGVEEPSSGVCTCGLTALLKEIEDED